MYFWTRGRPVDDNEMSRPRFKAAFAPTLPDVRESHKVNVTPAKPPVSVPVGLKATNFAPPPVLP